MTTIRMKPKPNKPVTDYICNRKHLEYATKCTKFLENFPNLKVSEVRCHGERPYPYTCWYVSFSHANEEEMCFILNFEIHPSDIFIEFRFLKYVPRDMLTKWAWRIRNKWIYVRFNDHAESKLKEIVGIYSKTIRADFNEGKLKYRKQSLRVRVSNRLRSRPHKQFCNQTNMMQINEEHLTKFQQIERLFRSKTKVPTKDNWRLLSDNEIWLEIVAQVIVVGRSDPLDRLKENAELKSKIAYENLKKIEDEGELKKRINQVLLATGTRYASTDISKCRKTEALAYNLKTLKSFERGPKRFLKKLSDFSGDKQKIKYVMDHLKYIKSKGARDLLMELGLVGNTIALDARVQNVLQKLGVEMPKDFASNPRFYDQIESEILTKVCKPLGISGVEFDRMLYQNYEDLLKMEFK